jgi:predicted RND superfamily exporter protein
VSDTTFSARMEHFIFAKRGLVLVAFAVVTLAMLFFVFRGLRIDASFTKQLPLQHEALAGVGFAALRERP